MLSLPQFGVRISSKVHNCRLDAMADWVEGSALFCGSRVSKSDVVDCLCENHIYRDQLFAAQFVDDVWNEIRDRVRAAGHPAVSVDNSGVEPVESWADHSAYSFCLALALCRWLPSWAKNHSSSYAEQGALFEQLTESSLAARGWRLLRTGWSATRVNQLSTIVAEVSEHVGEPVVPGGIGRWTKRDAKDAELDLVCDLPFEDQRRGCPLFLVQCASGVNWPDKRRTPDLDLWCRLVDFSNKPQRGFALPFALLEEDFRHTCGKVNGIVLDRVRLAFPCGDSSSEWLGDQLKGELQGWLDPRVTSLVADSDSVGAV